MMFFERFQELCEEKQMSVTGFLKHMGWSTSKVTRWKQSPPTVSTLNYLANYFNVSVDYLLGNTDERRPDNKKTNTIKGIGLNELDKALLSVFKALPPVEQEKVIEYANLLKLSVSVKGSD